MTPTKLATMAGAMGEITGYRRGLEDAAHRMLQQASVWRTLADGSARPSWWTRWFRRSEYATYLAKVEAYQALVAISTLLKERSASLATAEDGHRLLVVAAGRQLEEQILPLQGLELDPK